MDCFPLTAEIALQGHVWTFIFYAQSPIVQPQMLLDL
jgi:hypothetical protein